METVHVLVVSDNANDIAKIEDLLRTEVGSTHRFHVELEDRYMEALKALVGNKYDVYLVDQIVPNSGVSGVDLIRKANAGGCRSPLLLLTTLSDEDVEIPIEECGAAGHINKNLDFESRVFRNALRYAISHNSDVLEVRQQLTELQRQVSGLIHAFDRRP